MATHPPEDLTAFAARNHDRLVGTLWLYTGDREVAEELAQEALTRACRDWEKVRRMDAPGPWVHRVAINLANSHFRRRGAERRARARHEMREERERTQAPADTAQAIEVRRAVAALPRRQREVVVLRYFADLTIQQVAEATGATTSSVTSLLHRARRTLATTLGAELDDPDPVGPPSTIPARRPNSTDTTHSFSMEHTNG